MAKKHESKWNIEDLTDPEIYDGIRYLEPLRRRADEQNDDTAALLVSVIFVILMIGLGFLLLYR